MRSDVKELTEVVVVGYGTQERKNLTGSVASVSADDIKNIPIVSVDQALQGRAAGVQVTQNSGTPGGGIAVRVRGANSISAGSEPLYVVDGVPINTGSYSGIAVGNQQTNALSDLNPNDIASIEVLKDAAAASIYGSRAGNGVVLITTKRGSNQKTRINLEYYTGVQQAWKKLDVLTGPEFEALINEQRAAAGAAARYPNPEQAVTTNWQDEIFRNAPISNYTLTAAVAIIKLSSCCLVLISIRRVSSWVLHLIGSAPGLTWIIILMIN
jgi:TonB-dependent SusC/RagA subfamily outer membrane receptor